MKEITFQEFLNEYNFANFHDDWGIAVVRDNMKVNGLTISWGSLGFLWNKPTFTLYVHESRYSKHLLDREDSYSINILDRPKYQKELDIFGSKSGKDVDKVKESGLTLEEDLSPYFKESKYVLICKKVGQTKFDESSINPPESIKMWYKKSGVHTMYFGEIIRILKNE